MKTTNDKHAPSPWTLSDDADVVLNARRNTVAELRVDHESTNRITEFNANARLIAASPDLLAALQNIVATAPGDIDCEDSVEKYRSFVLRVACAALAAVEGGAK